MNRDESGLESDPMEEIDHISELPDPIIHHILSFLPFKSAIKTSLLSKKFRSALLSSFTISLELFLPNKNIKRFLNGMHDFLGRRSADVNLQRFRFFIRPYKYEFPEIDKGFESDRIDSAIDYAIKKGVKELQLNFTYNYCLPLSVLSAQSIAVLILQGFQIEKHDLMLNLDNLENLSMTNCSGFQTLMVSCRKVKILKVDACSGLKNIEIVAPNLEFVDLAGNQWELIENCCFSECKLVKHISMTFIQMTETLSMCEISMLSELESLMLVGCKPLKSLLLSNPILKTIKLGFCEGLKKIMVSSPHLQSFVCKNMFSQQCDINIAACKFLKEMELGNLEITDQWLESNVSNKKLGFLEDLKLSMCNKLENFTITHRNLKRIEIHNCPMVKVAEIDVKQLDSASFIFKPNIAAHLIVHSLQANVKLFLYNAHGVSYNLKVLRDNLSFLGHCRQLELVCYSGEVLIFPEESRENFISPLYDLQRLRLELKEPIKELWDLVDSLLWFAPKPVFVSILSGSSKEKCLEFRYLEPAARTYTDPFCCHFRPVKCWRHNLEEVVMENFEPTEMMILEKFMRQKAMRLKKISQKS